MTVKCSFSRISRTNNQRGVALVIVLMVIALTTILATQMSSSLIFQQQRNENLESNQQAYWYAMGAEAFAKSVLYQDFQDDKNVTHLGQRWAIGETRFPVDLGEISGEIKDAQACLNLNALINDEMPSNNSLPTANSQNNNAGNTNNQNNTSNNAGNANNQNNNANNGSNNPNNPNNNAANPGGNQTNGELAKAALKELIIALEVDGIGNFEAESMTEALVDWLDEDNSIVSAGGAEDDDYASKEYPYLAANSKLASVNELRVIEHFTPQVILAMKPYVCVLPNNDLHQININTLDAEDTVLLQALLGGTDAGTAQDILSARPEDGFKTIGDFTSLSQLANVRNINQFKQQFVVDSQYFTLTTKTNFNGSYFTLNSIFKVDNNKLLVINRSIGAH
ncbi:type II secretion system minor pseudopilin GspK [Thalassotalea mangrovi]|uniref:General secretion pathway protein GspK n=1 Tax=Thalassotalea mangrovi TaxID=2572245 RepID=A0A4U1B9J0_9GAMM|nr:type II secretion system minor pseudopilin GspK [Thalassotalea mangrovi]TKB46682.1 general secretion pathway protein GspK [Thalassotalea mangrovi]